MHTQKIILKAIPYSRSLCLPNLRRLSRKPEQSHNNNIKYFFSTLYTGEVHFVGEYTGFYFLVYYVAMNAVWVVVPLMMIYYAYADISNAYKSAQNRKLM